MNTPPLKHWPERDAFFEWFDERKKVVKIPHDSVIARMAGLDGSAVSSWRSGRTRPTAASLTAIAKVLEATAQETWARAGHLTAAEIEAVDQPALPDDWGVEIIRNSALPPDAKKAMIAAFLDQQRRDREEKERQLRRQIEIMNGVTAVD